MNYQHTHTLQGKTAAGCAITRTRDPHAQGMLQSCRESSTAAACSPFHLPSTTCSAKASAGTCNTRQALLLHHKTTSAFQCNSLKRTYASNGTRFCPHPPTHTTRLKLSAGAGSVHGAHTGGGAGAALAWHCGLRHPGGRRPMSQPGGVHAGRALRPPTTHAIPYPDILTEGVDAGHTAWARVGAACPHTWQTNAEGWLCCSTPAVQVLRGIPTHSQARPSTRPPHPRHSMRTRRCKSRVGQGGSG